MIRGITIDGFPSALGKTTLMNRIVAAIKRKAPMVTVVRGDDPFILASPSLDCDDESQYNSSYFFDKYITPSSSGGDVNSTILARQLFMTGAYSHLISERIKRKDDAIIVFSRDPVCSPIQFGVASLIAAENNNIEDLKRQADLMAHLVIPYVGRMDKISNTIAIDWGDILQHVIFRHDWSSVLEWGFQNMKKRARRGDSSENYHSFYSFAGRDDVRKYVADKCNSLLRERYTLVIDSKDYSEFSSSVEEFGRRLAETCADKILGE